MQLSAKSGGLTYEFAIVKIVAMEGIGSIVARAGTANETLIDVGAEKERIMSCARFGWFGMLLSLASASWAADLGDRPVTFAKDIAPIFQAKCQDCHRAGSMAPMALVTYEKTQ